QLFFQFGSCKILQSDNGKKFTARIIKDLKIKWPELVILNGRPRHPQSQGLVERGNSTLCDILGKCMHDRDTSHWVSWLLPAIYSMNTSIAQGIKYTPFEVVLGQRPRLNMTLWQSISDQGIEDDDDIPPSIRKQLEDAPDTDVPEMEDYISAPLLHTTPVDQQIASIHSATMNNLTSANNVKKNILDESSTSNLGLAEFSHAAIRS
ncbi:unnamed protein product, partial [Rotaria magnacalcarata]